MDFLEVNERDVPGLYSTVAGFYETFIEFIRAQREIIFPFLTDMKVLPALTTHLTISKLLVLKCLPQSRPARPTCPSMHCTKS